MPSADKKIVVGFDLDGVIVDHAENKITMAMNHGIILTPPETHSEVMRHLVPKSVYEDIQEHIYGEAPDALSAPLVSGAREALLEIKNAGVSFVLISRRRRPQAAFRLLEEHGLLETVFSESNVHLVSQKAEKDDVARALGVTHYFDDEEGVLALMPSVPNRYLFDVYGQFSQSAEFTRARDWSDVLSIVLRQDDRTNDL